MTDDTLTELEEQLLAASDVMREENVALAARLFETWAHTVYMIRSDLSGNAEVVMSLGAYLEQEGRS